MTRSWSIDASMIVEIVVNSLRVWIVVLEVTLGSWVTAPVIANDLNRRFWLVEV